MRLLLLPLLALPVSAQGLINHARNGTATQSTTGSGGVPERAIDGSTVGIWSADSTTHTTNAPGSWWEVDLGPRVSVLEVVLHNRADCCETRLSNFRVTLFDGANEVYGEDFHTAGTNVPLGGSETMHLPVASFGTRVRVELLGPSPQGENVLSLAEVQVLGPSPGLRNLALTGVASQSTTSHSGVPGRATDGIIDPIYNNGSITHTDGAFSNNWWEVNLLNLYSIEEIHLHNRGDCCEDRLSNFRVSIFQGQTEVWGINAFVASGNVPSAGRYVIDPPSGIVGDRVRYSLHGMNNAGNGVISLSEVQVFGGEIGTTYCLPFDSSLGEWVLLRLNGSEEVGVAEMTLAASDLPPNQPTLAFYGEAWTHQTMAGGILCVAPGTAGWYQRIGTFIPSGSDGRIEFPFDFANPPSSTGTILPGSSWCFQLWYQDPGDPAGYGFSSALEVTFQ